tara:strand:- start:161 stop:313 length:153 start_codon:yes stop_codon:yes gene_type:complete
MNKKYLKVLAISNLIQRKLDAVNSENKYRTYAEVFLLQDLRYKISLGKRK